MVSHTAWCVVRGEAEKFIFSLSESPRRDEKSSATAICLKAALRESLIVECTFESQQSARLSRRVHQHSRLFYHEGTRLTRN